MGHRLRMSAELGDWFAELGSSQPGSSLAAAEEIAASLAAVLGAADEPAVTALAMVTDLAAEPADDPYDHREAVDDAYQELLEALSVLRRQVADAGSYRSSSRHRITKSGSEPLPFTPVEIAAFEARERSLREQSQRYQSAVNYFRATKEAAKARYTAAQAGREIQLALLASAAEAGLTIEETANVRRDLARAEANLVEAAEQIAAARAEASRTARRMLRDAKANQARQIAMHSRATQSDGVSAESDDDLHGDADSASDRDTDSDRDGGPGDDADETDKPVPAGLLELRADPLGSDARLLFAVEPQGTITLLAVLDDAAAASEHWDEAIRLAGELLEEIRADGWPDTPAPGTDAPDTADGLVALAGAAAFLDRYFAGNQSGITKRAAVLATARTLGGLRTARDMSIADVATRSGLSAREVWQLESDGIRSADVGELALYLGALDMRLDLSSTDVPLR